MKPKIIAIKTAYNILMIAVILLVMIAVLTNIDKFKPSDKPVKYIQVVVKDDQHLNSLVNQYCDENDRKIFESEIKRINNIDENSFIYNKTLIIPVMLSN